MTILTAIAIAMEDSVTVSMGLLTNGVFRVSFFVKADVRSWREGRREGGGEGVRRRGSEGKGEGGRKGGRRREREGEEEEGKLAISSMGR